MPTNANTEMYDRAIHRAAMVRLYERRINKKIDVVFDGHVVELDKLLREATLSDAGLKKLRDAVDNQLASTYKRAFSTSRQSLLDLATDQVSYAYQGVESLIGKIWKTERPQKRVAEELVLDTPLYNNVKLEAGWSNIAKGERKRIELAIRKGIADGRTIDQMAFEIRKGSIHTISRGQARGLVITAATAVTTQADHAVYKVNAKALVGYQYVAVLDSRTTPLCAHRDGEIYQIGDTEHLPPAHFHCRSTTVPVFKSWQQMAELEGVAQVRRENLKGLSDKQVAFYDGQLPTRETYHEWLMRQPSETQFQHLGDYEKVKLFQTGQLGIEKFSNPEGNSIGIKELRKMTDAGYVADGDTFKFAAAKRRLDSMQLWARSPEDFYGDPNLVKTLRDYYVLQTRELEGTLSLTNYRGALIGNKKMTKRRVLNSPPTEEQLKFNPVTGRYEDVRRYTPNPAVYANNMRLLEESDLKDVDKVFIKDFVDGLEDRMSINERAVILDNLRIIFGRFRKNGEPWANFKAVVQSQIKFDVMNVSDAIETHIRRDTDLVKKLRQSNYIDPVLGPTQLQELHDMFIPNILRRNAWEDTTAPKIARELRNAFDRHIPLSLKVAPNGDARLSERDLHQFYLKFAHRLALADSPDRDQLAAALGRDLYNLANLNGDRKKWYETGMALLNADNVKKFFEIETFGVQKRRMKSRLSGAYFGPYYDTLGYNIRITDPRIQEYAQLTRRVEVGLRVGVTTDKNKLLIREGFKTYFVDRGKLGLEDTRIPITSTTSFGDFPVEFVDKDLSDALNWASSAKYRIDNDYYDFVSALLNFEDDRGNAALYDGLNSFKKHLASRGDSYERLKAMEWLRRSEKSFSNHAFIDHRARIYDRGLISPQSGETFRPFLNTESEKAFSRDDFFNFQDQIGSFIGGLSDKLEGSYNSLSFTGRQKVAERWRPEMVRLGNHMLRGKPNDIRAVLSSELATQIDGEDIGKFYRFAIETAKIDNFLKSPLKGSYREGGSIVHDGLTYDADAVFALAENKPVKKFAVKELEWVLKYDEPNARRVASADTGTPIIVAYSKNGRLTVIDGLHRLARAKADGLAELPARFVSNKELELARPVVDPYSEANLQKLANYKIALALEQDASSSGAQIIALTTRNKQLAELSNVIPTSRKKRLYDEIASATFNDPRFRKLNERLGLSEKDLKKAAKAQNMVTFYGAGERTGIMNVEGKLAKALGKETATLVVKAADRDTVLNEISARIARYERFDPDTAEALRVLRKDVKDVFNKGLDPGLDILDQLHFLEPKTFDLVEKLSHSYDKVVTPDDFKLIAGIMSEHLREQVPILKDFTRYFGRLAEDFLTHAKPSNSAMDWTELAKATVVGDRKKGFTLPERLSELLGLKAGESVSEKFIRRFAFWNPEASMADLIYGAKSPENRRTGFTLFKVEIAQALKLLELKVFKANKLPKRWTNVPWINFDGKTIEQNFTQTFEERLSYKDKDGNWVNNILQVPQKTEATWWEQVLNKDGKINDIADATKARTAFAVNGNHSNDAVIVKQFHLWGRSNGIRTSTIHDAFFTNIADMLPARAALKGIYARSLEINVIKATLDEMLKRGLPKDIYDKYLEEAIELGLIPVVGKSKIGGKAVAPSDILKKEDILRNTPFNFSDDYGWYAVG